MMKRLACMLLFALLLTVSAALAEAFSPVGTWYAVRMELPEGGIDLIALDATWPTIFREDMTVSIDGEESIWQYGTDGEIIVTGAESGTDSVWKPDTFTDKDGVELPCLCVESEEQGKAVKLIFLREEFVTLPEPEPEISDQYYTGLTQEFYTGTWEITALAVQGKINRNPAASNVFMTLRLSNGKGLWITGQEGNQSVAIISGTAVEQPVYEADFAISALRFQMENGRYAYLIPITNGQMCLSLTGNTMFLFDPVEAE